MKKRNCFAVLLLILCFGVSSVIAAGGGAAKPNIVIILADDLGWNAVGYHNPEVKTPNIDKLCKAGIELDNFYVSPMCSPTRAGLMTGRYPIRFGMARAVVPPWRNFGLDTEEVTIAEALARAGYVNRGIFGKWHLGHQQVKWHPCSRGFTEFLGCYNGAIDYFTHQREGELDWHHNEQSNYEQGYTTNLIGKAAADFISRSVRSGKPYFCYVPFNAPHSPFQAPQEYIDRYSHIKGKNRQIYFAMITAMDDEVGRILDAVEATGQADNTLVWFFSDNGGVGNIRDNNKPLHGSKLTSFEGGVRTVSCVKYPDFFPGGRKVTVPTAFIDILPTVMDLAGLSSDEVGCKKLDGVDLVPLLTGKENNLSARNLYFYHGQSGEHDEWVGFISGQWKLVVHGPSLINGRKDAHDVKLYKIASDPNEEKDVSKEYPDTVNKLIADFTEFRKLQPKNNIPPYDAGKGDYTIPKEWQISSTD